MSAELTALAQSMTAPLAAMDVTTQLRGREDMVNSLIRQLEQNHSGGRVHLLYGLGGSGKTSVAAEVARRVFTKGVSVWWVSAADTATLVSGLHSVARLAGARTDELQGDGAADVLWRRLGTLTKPWLLVLDNADEPSTLNVEACGKYGLLSSGRGWIRPFISGPGLVIITSRRGGDPRQWGNWLQPHTVGMLEPADGAQVLFDHTHGRGGSQVEAETLAERLGGLPLALSLAGSYLAQSIIDPWPEPTAVTTFNAYQTALNEGRIDVLEPRIDNEEDQAEEKASHLLIDRVWQLAIQFLESRKLPLAGQFMRLLAQFAPTPLPYKLILKRETLTRSSIFANLDHSQARSLLLGTSSLGLIDLISANSKNKLEQEDCPVLRVHPLMRDASYRYRDPTSDDTTYRALASILLIEATADEADNSPEDHHKWPTWQLLAPHAFHLLQEFPNTPDQEKSLVDSLARVVDLATRHLFCCGLRSQAKAEYDSMHRICRDILGSEHPRTLAARHGIALCLTESGDYSAAQAEYEDILELRRRILGEEHPDTLTTRGNLAGILHDRGYYATAQAENEAILEIRRRTLGEEHRQTLLTRHSLASVLHDRGDYATAQNEYEAILKLRRRTLGEDHSDTLITRSDLAGVLQDRGDSTTAQNEYEAVLEIQRSILDEEHPNILTTRNNLSGVLRDRGEYSTAQKENEAILEIRRRTLGEEHPLTLTTRHNLASVLRDRGEYSTAKSEYEAILKLERSVLGEEHRSTLTTRNHLAGVLRDCGDHMAARAEFEATLDLQYRTLGEEHPDTLTTRHNLAITYLETGRHPSAEAEMHAVLIISERVFGLAHPRTKKARNALKLIRQQGAHSKQPILWHGPGKRKKKKKR